MAKYYAPNFSGLLPLFDGKSAAGGKLYAYRAGSSIPAPLFDEDGTELGTSVSIDSNGCADFLIDSALSYKLIAKDALGAVVGEWDNVKATNAPGMDNPMTAHGDLIVGGTGGAATALPAGNDDQMLTPYTQDGVKKLKWKNVPAQTGDHKVMVDGSDTSPDYLAAKLAAGSGISLTNTGSAVEIAATAQTGDHQLLVSATDAAAGYLGAKLTAGSNVTITPHTAPDTGAQTLELSATGGGGGGGGSFYDYVFGYNCMPSTTRAPSGGYTLYFSYIAMRDGSPSGIFVPEAVPQTWTNIKCTIAIYEYKNLENASCAQLAFGNATITSTASDRILRIPFTTTQNISAGTRVWVALCFSSYVDFNYRTISASGTYYCKYKQYTPTAGDTFNANGTSDISNVPICGIYYTA